MQEQAQHQAAVEQAVIEASAVPIVMDKKPEDFTPLTAAEAPEVQRAMNQDVIYRLGERVVGLENERMVDEKTGAGSEYAFNKDLGEILAQRPEDARIILLDLNGFKEFNDTLGHGIGDEALREFVGGNEEVAWRTGEKIYRIGGDEFVVISDLKEARGRERRKENKAVEHERRTGHDRRQASSVTHGEIKDADDQISLGRDDTPEGLEKRIENGFKGADYIFHSYLENINVLNEAKPGEEKYIDPESWNINASWGVADYEEGDTVESLKQRADVAMYKMKQKKNDAGSAYTQMSLFGDSV